MLFLPFVQNIINFGLANENMNREIIALMTHIKSLPKFKGIEHEAKVQNVLVLLINKSAIGLRDITSTHAIFNILMSLSNQTQKALWNKTLNMGVQISLLHLN